MNIMNAVKFPSRKDPGQDSSWFFSASQGQWWDFFFFLTLPLGRVITLPLEGRSSFTKELSGINCFQGGTERSPKFALAANCNVFYGLRISPWEASGSGLEFSSSWLLWRYQLCHSTHPYYPPRPCCETAPPHCPFLHCQWTAVPAQMEEGHGVQRVPAVLWLRVSQRPICWILSPHPTALPQSRGNFRRCVRWEEVRSLKACPLWGVLVP